MLQTGLCARRKFHQLTRRCTCLHAHTHPSVAMAAAQDIAMPGCRLRPPPWLGISSSLGPLPPPLALEPPHTLLLPLHDQHDTRRQGRGCTELQAKSNMSAHPNQASSRLARNRARARTLARMVAGCGQSEPLRGLLSLWRLARSRGRSTLQPISTEHVHYRELAFGEHTTPHRRLGTEY